jgi:hypothetical protein
MDKKILLPAIDAFLSFIFDPHKYTDIQQHHARAKLTARPLQISADPDADIQRTTVTTSRCGSKIGLTL